jgi:hypothetical protein
MGQPKTQAETALDLCLKSLNVDITRATIDELGNVEDLYWEHGGFVHVLALRQGFCLIMLLVCSGRCMVAKRS